MSGGKRKFEDIDCIVCLEQLAPPVYQCCKGHLLCMGCLETLEQSSAKCPMCREDLPKPRVECLVFQQIAKHLEYSCGNVGCQKKMRFDQIRRHRVECPYRAFECGFCEASFSLDDLILHYSTQHGDDCVAVVEFKTISKRGKQVKHSVQEEFIRKGGTDIVKIGDMLFLVAVAKPEDDESDDDESGVFYAFAVALAPGNTEEAWPQCKLTFSKDGSNISCEGPAYHYEQWLASYQSMIENGCAFALPHDWADDDGYFKYTLDITIGE